MLASSVDDVAVIVICGGEFVLKDDANSRRPNDECFIVDSDEHHNSAMTTISRAQDYNLSGGGLLNRWRKGTASLVLDSGRTLWLTGGSFGGSYGTYETEFLTVDIKSSNSCSSSSGFPTNGGGPDLPGTMFHHCLEKIGPAEVLVIAGTHNSNNGPFILNKIEVILT